MTVSRMLAVLAVGFFCLHPQSGFASNASADTAEGTTVPSEAIPLGFTLQGLIDQVKVEKGTVVKAGELLIALDSRVETSLLEYYNLQADTSLQVEAAQKRFDLATTKLSMIEDRQSRAPGSVTPYEMDEARAEAAVARIEIDIAKRRGQEAAAQAQAQQHRIDMMQIKAPFDGIVLEVMKKKGEVVRETDPVIQIVKLDPLYIDLKLLDVNLASRLTVGQSLKVRYRGEDSWQTANVKFVSPVANAASRTRYVQLELPNPNGREAGLEVEVEIPSAVASGNE